MHTQKHDRPELCLSLLAFLRTRHQCTVCASSRFWHFKHVVNVLYGPRVRLYEVAVTYHSLRNLIGVSPYFFAYSQAFFRFSSNNDCPRVVDNDQSDILITRHCFFDNVTCAKPRSSRNSSVEAFVVCQGYNPPADFSPSLLEPLLDSKYDSATAELGGSNAVVVPFVACGDLSGFDADQSYPLQLEGEAPYEHRPPVAAPLSASYIDAVRKKRGAGAVGAGGVDEAAIPTVAPTAAAQESWRQGGGSSGSSESANTADAAAESGENITNELNGSGCALVAVGIVSIAIAMMLGGKRR